MSDLIDKQVVLDTIHRFFTEEVDKIPTKKTEDGEVLVIHKCQPLFEMNKTICKRIKALPSVPTVQAVPIEVLQEIRHEIENRINNCGDGDFKDGLCEAFDIVYYKMKGIDPE